MYVFFLENSKYFAISVLWNAGSLNIKDSGFHVCKLARLPWNLCRYLICAEVLDLFFFTQHIFSSNSLHLLSPRSTTLFKKLMNGGYIEEGIKGTTAAWATVSDVGSLHSRHHAHGMHGEGGKRRAAGGSPGTLAQQHMGLGSFFLTGTVLGTWAQPPTEWYIGLETFLVWTPQLTAFPTPGGLHVARWRALPFSCLSYLPWPTGHCWTQPRTEWGTPVWVVWTPKNRFSL